MNAETFPESESVLKPSVMPEISSKIRELFRDPIRTSTDNVTLDGLPTGIQSRIVFLKTLSPGIAEKVSFFQEKMTYHGKEEIVWLCKIGDIIVNAFDINPSCELPQGSNEYPTIYRDKQEGEDIVYLSFVGAYNIWSENDQGYENITFFTWKKLAEQLGSWGNLIQVLGLGTYSSIDNQWPRIPNEAGGWRRIVNYWSNRKHQLWIDNDTGEWQGCEMEVNNLDHRMMPLRMVKKT